MKTFTSFMALFAVAALGTGCSSTTEHRFFSPEAASVTLEQEFTLQPGQSANVAPGSFSIRFDSVGADSRCATDVVCVWAGDAAIHLSVVADGAVRPVVLHSTLDPKFFSQGNVKVTLVRVTPENISTRTIPQSEYRVTFVAN